MKHNTHIYLAEFLHDDPPSATDTGKPGPATRYLSESAHGTIEDLWDTLVAVAENIIAGNRAGDFGEPTDLSPFVRFPLDDRYVPARTCTGKSPQTPRKPIFTIFHRILAGVADCNYFIFIRYSGSASLLFSSQYLRVHVRDGCRFTVGED